MLWRVDPWEAVAAEVSAAQGITAAAAGSLLHNALCLHQRLPQVAALFATGALDYRSVRMIVARTLLALDAEALAAIDAELAEAIGTWGPISLNKMQVAIDRIVEHHDPDARRRTDSRVRDRFVDVQHDREVSHLSGQMNQADATLLDRRLTAMARSVCENDPRTTEQRRADALGALAAGHTALRCACGNSDCPVEADEGGPAVVIHVLAEADALDAAEPAELHGERPEDDTCEVITSLDQLAEALGRTDPAAATGPPPPAGAVLGGPLIPAAVLADLARRGLAEVRPLIHPGCSPPEPRYRPSRALADFVRCRDQTCRFPGCAKAAEFCDVDHTVPFGQGGATHASNLKLLCRLHHLVKTFWTGGEGWRDRQFADGSVEWTSPSGNVYRTLPGSTGFLPTGPPDLPDRRGGSGAARGVMMPRRARTRNASRHARVRAERARNASGRGAAGSSSAPTAGSRRSAPPASPCRTTTPTRDAPTSDPSGSAAPAPG